MSGGKPILMAVALLLAGAFADAERPLAAGEPQAILLAAGDITGCDGEEMKSAAATAAVLAREIDVARKQRIPVKVVVLGDLAYEDGTKRQFACFRKTWGAVLAKKLADPAADVLPVPGNHDYGAPGAKWFFRTFERNVWIGAGRHPYYQLTFPENAAGAWRLFGLNSEIGNARGSRQFRWLEPKLAASPERCVLAFWHRPVFSSGQHGHADSDDLASAEPVKQAEMADIEALLAAAGATAVLNGHDHHYEELAPHDEQGRPAPDGLRGFIAGTGGRALYQRYARTWPSISANYDTASHGILKLSLYPGRYSWSFLPAGAGAVVKYAGEAECNRRKPVE